MSGERGPLLRLSDIANASLTQCAVQFSQRSGRAPDVDGYGNAGSARYVDAMAFEQGQRKAARQRVQLTGCRRPFCLDFQLPLADCGQHADYHEHHRRWLGNGGPNRNCRNGSPGRQTGDRAERRGNPCR